MTEIRTRSEARSTMETINIKSLTSGYRDRMRRLALMDPLDELAGKRTKDRHGLDVDMRGLGMLTLLFFFERRLSRRAYQTSRKDVTEFLLRVTADTYDISFSQMEKITNDLMEVFRPVDGKKRRYQFFNWEMKEEDEISYTIIKDNGFDTKTTTQFYTLDEDGLELLFATKEFYSEFQISINQLLLKQQINKGQFHDALRQVREMELNVMTLVERFEKMRQEIVRSIISDQTFERYKQLIEEAYERFEREDEEFNTLKQFIQETRDTLYSENLKQKETESYELIHRIGNELDDVHYEHTRLIELTAQLRNTAIATAQESLYYTGVQSFNFEKDIVATILGRPLSPDIMRGITHPFLKVEQNPTWSLLTVLADQNIMEERSEQESYHFIEAAEDTAQQEYRKWLGEKYGALMEKFLEAYETGEINSLRDWMDELQTNEPNLLSKRYFYSFWLFMHQTSPIHQDDVAGHDSETILKYVFEQIGHKQLIVTELDDVIRYHDHYSIQNMKITIEPLPQINDELDVQNE